MYFFIKAFLLPPFVFLPLIIVGWVLRKRMPLFSGILVVGSVLAIYVLSTAYVSTRLLVHLEQTVALSTPVTKDSSIQASSAQAIVVLSAGQKIYQGGMVSPDDLGVERLTAALSIHRITGLPMLLSGGVLRSGYPMN